MLTVITDDLVIDLEQVLYLSNSHPYTLRFRGGEELELTLAEGQAVIAKLKEAEAAADYEFSLAYPGGCNPFETPIPDGATVTDTCCDNEVLREWWINRKNIFASDIDSVSSGFSSEEMARKHRLEGQETVHVREVKKDQIDADEYKYAVEACRVPVELKAKDCVAGTFYYSQNGHKVLCVRESLPTEYAQFVKRHRHKTLQLSEYTDNHMMRVADVQSW